MFINLIFRFLTKFAFDCSQRFEEAIDKLRDAYFTNITESSAVQSANINLLSDLNFGYGILKNVVLQTKANTNERDAEKRKNTFLSRFGIIETFFD